MKTSPRAYALVGSLEFFDDQDPMEQRANVTSGFTTVYSVPEPKNFILTNAF